MIYKQGNSYLTLFNSKAIIFQDFGNSDHSGDSWKDKQEINQFRGIITKDQWAG
jgi:hypothetical protein